MEGGRFGGTSLSFLHVNTAGGKVLGFVKAQCAYYFPHDLGPHWAELGRIYSRVEILAEAGGRWFLGPVEIAHSEETGNDESDSTEYPLDPYRPPPRPAPPRHVPGKRQDPCPFMTAVELIVGLFKPIGVFSEITAREAACWLYTHLGHIPTRAEHSLAGPTDPPLRDAPAGMGRPEGRDATSLTGTDAPRPPEAAGPKPPAGPVVALGSSPEGPSRKHLDNFSDALEHFISVVTFDSSAAPVAAKVLLWVDTWEAAMALEETFHQAMAGYTSDWLRIERLHHLLSTMFWFFKIFEQILIRNGFSLFHVKRCSDGLATRRYAMTHRDSDRDFVVTPEEIAGFRQVLKLARLPIDPASAPMDRTWIVGRRRQLNAALGRSESYPHYLERLRDEGVLELERRGTKFAIRLVDPVRHAEVAARLARRSGV
jgi:hypothetical protein